MADRSPAFGELLPQVTFPPPGSVSRWVADVLRAKEARAASTLHRGPLWPGWHAAAGANVQDLDGNLYIDLTAAFGTANVGHRNPKVMEAVAKQARDLVQGLGDVAAHRLRAVLVNQLAELVPCRGEAKVLLGSTGSEAVELALKAATAHTGKPGFIAFVGGFHGTTLGALSVTGWEVFRRPFAAQLNPHVTFLPYPDPYRHLAGDSCGAAVLQEVERVLEQGATNTTAAVIVEPVQGRAGEVVPPLDFLPGLRALCDAFGVLLIVDEIFTGCGRTGAWFGVDHWNVEPDLVCLGKGLGGGLPISAVVGSAHVLDSWDLPSGPAAHSSTFMAQPLGCAAALATIQELAERGLVERAERLGRQALARLREVAARRPLVGDVRGLGLMLGVELVRNRQTKEPAPELAEQVAWQMHQRGILMLTSGLHGNVLALTPPLVITEKQLDYALAALDEVLGQTEAGASQAP